MKKEILEDRIAELYCWMANSTFCEFKTEEVEKELNRLIENSDDIYELVLVFHLSNGNSIEVHNNCMETFIFGRYMGDELEMRDDLLYIGCRRNKDGDYRILECKDDFLFHQIYVAPEEVVWIDTYPINVDWKANKEYILNNF